MARRILSLWSIVSILTLAAATSADEPHRQSHGSKQWQPRQQERYGSWGGVSQIVSDFKNHHGHKPEPKTNPIPIDPGKGDGRVPVATPPARDGFVWVGDHWERAKAPPKPANPYPPGVVVRDHRTTSGSYPAGTIVRDHRATESSPGGTTVQSHSRTPGSAGGVIVTRPWTDNATPTIRDHRTTPVVRDHRTTPVVRDHRTTPVVRDHREAPIVRDHRP